MDSEQKLSKSSDYSNLYKHNKIINNQNERRNKQLEELRRRRNDAVDELRNVTDLFETEPMEMQTEAIPMQKRKQKRFGVRLMLSEWMVDVPDDLEENWYFKVCPRGIRNLVIASGGVTRIYNRRGQLKGTILSALPGGGIMEEGGGAKNRVTLLDCIYRNQNQTFYVLDVLAWNSMCLLNCSAEFRFYFIESKLSEDARFSTREKKFKLISHKWSSKANISETFSDVFRPEIDGPDLPVDGVLFYHKDSIYTPGYTPLVGWLKPYMLPEKIDVLIDSLYLTQKPRSYTNLEDYVKKKTSGTKQDSEMEYSFQQEDESNSMDN